MSGPKLMELRRLRREARRRHNLDLCAGFDAEYPRLFAELQALCRRLETLGEPDRCTLPDPAEATRQTAEAIENNRDDDAVKAYQRRVLSAREEIEAARQRVAARLIELRERHRLVGLDLDRFRSERELLLAAFETLDSGGRAGAHPVPGDPRDEVTRVRESTCPDLVDWHAVAADDSSRLARAESQLGRLRDELRKGRARLNERIQQAGQAQADDLTPAHHPRSFADYWADRKSGATGSSPAPKDSGANTASSFDVLLKQAAAFPTSELYQAFCREIQDMESIADLEARRVRAEVFMIQSAERIREHRQVLRFREDVRAMLDQMAPFEELATDALVQELRSFLSGPIPSDVEALKKRHAEKLDHARARREREDKRKALLDSLRELGYEANEGLETAFTNSGRLVVHKPAETEYAVEFVADAGFGKVQTAMLRYSGSAEMSEQQRLRDREREAAWCGDHGKLRGLMERRGWESGLTMQRPPGEHPVRVVVDPARARRTETSTAPGKAMRDLTQS